MAVKEDSNKSYLPMVAYRQTILQYSVIIRKSSFLLKLKLVHFDF